MAHHKSALKRIRSSEKRRTRNRQDRKKLKTLAQAVRSSENKEVAQQALAAALPFIDKISAKGILHKNKAARQKSKLTKFVNKM